MQQQTFYLPNTKPAGMDEISIQLYSKYKLTQDTKAQLSHYFTTKLIKSHGNRLLIIGSKVGIFAKIMEPHCSEIHLVAQEKYIPILQALLLKKQTVKYRFNYEGFIGQDHIIPKRAPSHCKHTVIEVSKFREYVQKNIHYNIVILQNVIVHPQINIFKQLMRLHHDILISMIIPGKLVYKGLFQLLSGIQKNILYVFYNQALHEKVEYMRYITARRQEINIWEVFVWIKKNTEDSMGDLKKVSDVLQMEVNQNKVGSKISGGDQDNSFYQTETALNQYLSFHYGQTEYFGTKNFAVTCAQRVIRAAKEQHIEGRALDIGCAVGRSTIQLASYFKQVIGLEYSKNFVKVANNILQEKYKDLKEKVKFIQGDACNLRTDIGKFDVVFAGNLIDRVYDPQKFLRGIIKLMNQKSLLIISSPYSWLEQFTKVQKWIGGKQIDGKNISTYNGLKQILYQLGIKQFKHAQDIRYVIQENPWVYQYTNSQITYWGKF